MSKKKSVVPVAVIAAVVTIAVFTASIFAVKLLGGSNEPDDTVKTAATPSEVTSSEDVSSSADTSSEDAQSQSAPTESYQNPAPVIKSAATLDKSKVAELLELDNTKKGWGQGTTVDSDNRPTGCDWGMNKWGQYGAKFIMENEKKIYLTFDEGYEAGYTAKILDVLKEKKVKAIFFVTMDYVKKSPELVRRMIDEGHVVGNHSTKHKSFPEMDFYDAVDDIVNLHNYVVDNFHYEMKVFRFPMGEYSTRMVATVKALGYDSVFWSFAYQDWDTAKQPDPDAAYKRITEATHPGALYLLHAVSKTNTELLGRLVDYWQSNGYTIQRYPV